jgi:hypothetical protein
MFTYLTPGLQPDLHSEITIFEAMTRQQKRIMSIPRTIFYEYNTRDISFYLDLSCMFLRA